MPPRTWLERVTDIIASAEHITELTRGSDFAAFASDRTVREAVLYNIVIIAEAARYVPAEVQARHPDVDWRGLRDIATGWRTCTTPSVIAACGRRSPTTFLCSFHGCDRS